MQDSTLVSLNETAYELLEERELASAEVLLDSVRRGTPQPTSTRDSVFKGQAICHLAHIHQEKRATERAMTLYDECVPLTAAMPPREQVRHLRNAASVHGQAGDYCTQRRAYGLAARTAWTHGLDSLGHVYDAYAGRAHRLCYDDNPTELTKASPEGIAAGCIVLAIIALIVGWMSRPLPLRPLMPE